MEGGYQVNKPRSDGLVSTKKQKSRPRAPKDGDAIPGSPIKKKVSATTFCFIVE